MTDQTLPCRDEMLDAFVKWRKDYALTVEPNYSAQTDYDCWSAWQAAWNNRAKASAPEGGNYVLVDRGSLKLALNVLDRSGNDEVADALRNGVLQQVEDTRSNAKAGEVDDSSCIECGGTGVIYDEGIQSEFDCLTCKKNIPMTKPEKACAWTQDEDDGSWDTACGNKHEFTANGPHENQYAFCPYCGNTLATQRGDGNEKGEA